MILPTQFLVYYRRADPVASINDVPVNEPLMIAHRLDKVVHYKLNRPKDSIGRVMWQIDVGVQKEAQPVLVSIVFLHVWICLS